VKVVLNRCYGGFGVSREALHRLRELGSSHALEETDVGEAWKGSGEVRKDQLIQSFLVSIPRDDKLLVQVVEELGSRASAHMADLEIVEIPDDVKWHIEDYDGAEWVAEDHRTWR